MQILTFESCWFGGSWLLDGSRVEFNKKSEATALIARKKFKVYFKETVGHDYDHGKTYPWRQFDPFIKCPECFNVDINLRAILEKNYKIRLEVTY